MNELIKLDPSFNEGLFISKVNNIFIMLHSALMMDDLDRVKHFLSPELISKYGSILRTLNDNHERQMYDELNVKTTSIENIDIQNDRVIIEVLIISRYMDYVINKDTGSFIRGNNKSRVEKRNYLTLEKYLNNEERNIITKCTKCGADIEINKSGKCPYCRTIYEAQKHDWVLISIDTR